jgi:DHA2 family methylenomycin A resistance protein-like MFS transporter
MAPVGGRITSRFGPRLPAAAGLLAAASGAHSGYADLLPAFLLWGIGCGLLTPAVVAAAIATVPAERSGLASAVNNTARQTGGAIGIAGQPGDLARFLRGFHAVALGSACLYAAAAAPALTLLPGALTPTHRHPA